MDDEYLVEPEDVTGLVLREQHRLELARLRGDSRFVEPVSIEIDADLRTVRETVDQLRHELLERYGFVPREIDVIDGSSGWRLVVDGEPVESRPKIGRDARGELLDALSRHLWRMLRLDDVAELLAFARTASPVGVDRAMPHVISIEQLHRVLVRLLREGVPIKPLDRIVEVIAEASAGSRDTVALVERVRLWRRRSIVEECRQADGRLRVVQLSQGALNACAHLSIEPIQPDARRTRFHDRVRRDLEGIRTEQRLERVVIVAPAASRYAAATALRPVCTDVLSDAELLDIDHEVVGTIGDGIRVPSPHVMPPAPPGVRGVTGSVWSVESEAAGADDWLVQHAIDVEVIE